MVSRGTYGRHKMWVTKVYKPGVRADGTPVWRFIRVLWNCADMFPELTDGEVHRRNVTDPVALAEEYAKRKGWLFSEKGVKQNQAIGPEFHLHMIGSLIEEKEKA